MLQNHSPIIFKGGGFLTGNMLYCTVCQFGSRWKLRVRYATALVNENLARLDHTCRTQNGRCSCTRRIHLPLKGRAPNGASYTNLAKSKPSKLLHALAYILTDEARARFDTDPDGSTGVSRPVCISPKIA